MLITEFRVILPLTLEEDRRAGLHLVQTVLAQLKDRKKVAQPICLSPTYRIGQLYSVANASKNETGGGEGVEVIKNEPFADKPLFDGKFCTGQYTHKIYHIASKIPSWLRVLMPKGSMDLHEHSWNAYPFCKTEITNPAYMKNNFFTSIETIHVQDRGESPNVHKLTSEELAVREVVFIDIANDEVCSSDYNPSEDPAKFRSEKTGRGPLGTNWICKTEPVMCCYKLVKAEFAWFGLQNRVQRTIINQERRLFLNFHRQMFCWIDKWYGLTIDDIRAIEKKTKLDLEQKIKSGPTSGTLSIE